jgi:hypothetical protein
MSDIGWLILAVATAVVAALLWAKQGLRKQGLRVMRRGRDRRRGKR